MNKQNPRSVQSWTLGLGAIAALMLLSSQSARAQDVAYVLNLEGSLQSAGTAT